MMIDAQDVKVKLVNERDRLYGLLLDVPFLTPYPSHSNFILCSVTDASKSAKQLKVKQNPISEFFVLEMKFKPRESFGFSRALIYVQNAQERNC